MGEDLTFFIFFLIVSLAQLSEAVSGFGSTIITLALGANLYPFETILPLIIPLNFCLSFYLVTRYRQSIDWNILKRTILPFFALGMAAGIFIFNFGQSRILQTIFGFLVILITTFELVQFFRVKTTAPNKPLKPLQSALCLIVGGIAHGIYATGGPMVVYYASRQLGNKKVFRSTLSFLWLIMTIVLCVNYYLGGGLTAGTLKTSALLLPALFLGIALGERIHARVDERVFRLIIYVLLFFAGFSLLLTGRN